MSEHVPSNPKLAEALRAHAEGKTLLPGEIDALVVEIERLQRELDTATEARQGWADLYQREGAAHRETLAKLEQVDRELDESNAMCTRLANEALAKLPAVPVASRTVIDSPYELHPRHMYRDGEIQGWEPLYAAPPASSHEPLTALPPAKQGRQGLGEIPAPVQSGESREAGEAAGGSAAQPQSPEPAAYLVVVREPGRRREFATLPGYSLEPMQTFISETPLYRHAQPPNDVLEVAAHIIRCCRDRMDDDPSIQYLRFLCDEWLKRPIQAKQPEQSPGLVCVGRLIQLDDGLGTVLVDWNEERLKLQPGTELYARTTATKGGE